MNKPQRTFYASWADEAAACMDYLHGDVTDDEFEAACAYEYARESTILREAAAIHHALTRREKARRGTGETKRTAATFTDLWIHGTPMTKSQETVSLIAEKHGHDAWFVQYPWAYIWQCPAFPSKPWNQLSKKERANILPAFASTDIAPLAMTDVATLDAMKIFAKFKTLASQAREQTRQNIAGMKPRHGTLYPVLHQDQWTWALFTIDFRKTKKRLLQEFEKWLELPENQKRFDDYERDPTGKTGMFKDRLKDLAGGRLYAELGFDKALKFTDANRKCSPAGAPLPFHDARKGQSNEVARNQAPLWSEPAAALKAKAKVRGYLAEIIPSEFEKRPKSKFLEIMEKALPNDPKISKSSS